MKINTKQLKNISDSNYRPAKQLISAIGIVFIIAFIVSPAILSASKPPIVAKRKSVSIAKSIQRERSWAEKLGFPSGKRVLLLHIDDVGMCPEANTSTYNYIEKGFLNSAAVMMPCPNAEEVIRWAKVIPKQILAFTLPLPANGPITAGGLFQILKKFQA